MKEIEKRIGELENQISIETQQLQQLHQQLTILNNQIMSKTGGLIELRGLLNKEQEKKK